MICTRHRDIRLVSKDVIEKAEMKRYFLSIRPIRNGKKHEDGRHELTLEEPILTLSGIMPTFEMMGWWDRLTLENLGQKATRAPATFELDNALSVALKLERSRVVPITRVPTVTEILHISEINSKRIKRLYAVIVGLLGEGAWVLVLKQQQPLMSSNTEALKSRVEDALRSGKSDISNISDQDSYVVDGSRAVIAKIKPGNQHAE